MSSVPLTALAATLSASLLASGGDTTPSSTRRGWAVEASISWTGVLALAPNPEATAWICQVVLPLLFRTAARMARAVVRLHPAVTLLPGVFALALLALFVAASAEGARVGLAKARVGLADAVAARGSEGPQTGAGQLQSAQITGVTVVFGVHARQAPVQHHHGKELARVALQSDASYIYPQAAAALIPRQRGGQPTLRPAPLAAALPYIPIASGPRDLAR